MSFGSHDDYHNVPTVGRISPVTDKDAIIPGDLWDPYYTDRRFTDGTSAGLTIFVDPEVTLAPGNFVDETAEELTYSYSDRVQQWVGHEAVRAASQQAAKEVGNNQSARFIENMLRRVFEDKNLWLGHMRAGVNRGNGHPYKIYGYRSDHKA